MKIGVLILYFNSSNTILKCIDNCSNFVDIIYISYSELPWSGYNVKARDQYRNNSNLDIIRSHSSKSKIKIIEGVWDTEESQRNAIVAAAKLDGVDYLIIQDPDEFYLEEEYSKNINEIRRQPDYPFYYCLWINFWKNLHHIVLERKNVIGSKFSMYSYNPNFAINLKYFPDIHFEDKRVPNYPASKGCMLSGICYHLSYVYSDDEMKIKIGTWGHSHQVGEKWMKYKWLGWNDKTKFINPMMGPVWDRAVRFDGELPAQLNDFPLLHQEYIPLNPQELKDEKEYDWNQLKLYVKHQTKAWLAKKLKLGQYKRSRK